MTPRDKSREVHTLQRLQWEPESVEYNLSKDHRFNYEARHVRAF